MLTQLFHGVLSSRYQKTVQAVVLVVGVFMLIVGLSIAPANLAKAAPLAACRTYTNIKAVDEGGGKWDDQHYYLYVYGTTDNRGTTYRWYQSGPVSGWVNTGWVAVSLLPNNAGLRVGVSTKWAYLNPFWKTMTYKYVIC